ncbi:AsmA family protein [Solirhodobacter olei]|uniref:AsmA family protein n=1 Tax=Solirhodobacter olei TaxID=2493082 RepID=UPI000FDBCA79|nr:AsmA family protein [Solirhodobacter olei]
MRWLFRLLGLIVLLAALAVAGLFLIPADRIAGLAAAQFEAATGRQMVISGGVHPTLWPELGVRAGHVEIANASWSKAGPMVTADGLVVGVDPLALLGGSVKVGRVELDAPKILLETGKDGHGNWELTPLKPAAPAKGAPAAGGSGAPGIPEITIGKAVITKGSVTYLDDTTGKKQTVSGIDATFRLPKASGPADLNLKATVNGQPVTLSAEAGKAAQALAGLATPVKLKLTAGSSTVGFDGSADPGKGAVKGALDAAITDLPALFKAAGMTAPALPQGLGAKKILLKGNLSAAAAGTVALDQAQVTLDGNALKGRVAVSLAGARPKLNAILSAGKLDLSALGGGAAPAQAASGGGKPAAGGAAAETGWSKAPIDASALKLADADVTLGADGLDLGTLKLGRTDVTLTLKDGRAVVGLKQVVAYQGDITGQVTADAGKGLSVAADINAAHVALQPLLTDFADYKRLIGTGTLNAKLHASGGSMDALMHALSGSGSMDLGKGELQGFDLAGMLTHLNANYLGPGAKTIFNSVKATYTIKGGVLTNNDLAFASPILDASGKGTVGIGDKTLDYVVTPVAFRGLTNGKGVSVPLKISGSWAKPRFGLDMGSALGQKIQTERQKLKDKAKSAVEKGILNLLK